VKKHVVVILTVIYLFSYSQITFAKPSQTSINILAAVTTKSTEQIDAAKDTNVQVNSESVQNDTSLKRKALAPKELKKTAGVLPGAIIYKLERAIEALKLFFTKNEEKLAVLKAEYAVERAAEATFLIENGKSDRLDKAAEEYLKTLTSSTEHLKKALDKVPEKTKEEIKALVEISEKMIENITKLSEQKDEGKGEYKKIEVDVKARNELKIIEEKAKEELRKQDENKR
jgi:hypothetical protein